MFATGNNCGSPTAPPPSDYRFAPESTPDFVTSLLVKAGAGKL